LLLSKIRELGARFSVTSVSRPSSRVHPQAVAKYSPHVTAAAPVLQPRPHAILISEGRMVSDDIAGEISSLDKEIADLKEELNMFVG
jgi:hypothetical protein